MTRHNAETTATTLATLRAASLAATRELGAPTGPGIESAIDLEATRALCTGLDLLTALQCDDADALAQQYGWQSAADLMAFLSEGPETARLPQ